MNQTISSNRIKGIICIILSALGFALMSACVKLAGDLPNFQKVFFRNLVSAIIALYLIIITDNTINIKNIIIISILTNNFFICITFPFICLFYKKIESFCFTYSFYFLSFALFFNSIYHSITSNLLFYMKKYICLLLPIMHLVQHLLFLVLALFDCPLKL